VHPHLSSAARRLCALAAAAISALTLAAPIARAVRLTTVATGLNQPKKITVTAGGDLVVALSGDGSAPKSCTDGEQRSCLDHSGAIDLITAAGSVRVLRTGLPSIAESHSDTQATGPVQALLDGDSLRVLFQNTTIDASTGDEIYGDGGSSLDTLTAFGTSGSATVDADFGHYEAAHNPDHGEGTNVADGDDAAKDSDPYGIVAYRGGYAIADAGANDVLWVSRSGAIHVLAVLPTIREGKAAAQPVPDAIAVSPDGALYVGELGGEPFDRGTSSIYRIVPGHGATRVATGFTAVDDMTFDRAGHLLVLELDRKGLKDPGLDTGDPASGALYSLDVGTGKRQLLVDRGLPAATGVAGGGRTVDLSIDGLSTGGGRIVSFREGS
jgi:hypothetical protein